MIRCRFVVLGAAIGVAVSPVFVGCANDYTCVDYRTCPPEGGSDASRDEEEEEDVIFVEASLPDRSHEDAREDVSEDVKRDAPRDGGSDAEKDARVDDATMDGGGDVVNGGDGRDG